MLDVVKANGVIEPFSEEKLRISIKRAGVPIDQQNEVLDAVTAKLYNNIPTSEIYHHIIQSLGRNTTHPYLSSRYSLKQAIMALGPTGYPFEDFVAKIAEENGYKTLVRQQLMGKCVMHEVDVIAEKDGRKIAIEAKFHNNPGTRSEVHVALYTKSRFEDLREKHAIDETWIVTNTKATIDAITFAECSGMRIISWSYPEQGSLRDMIEDSGLHPVTLLTTLSASQKQYLLQNHFVMCKDIRSNPTIIDMLHLTHHEKDRLMAEISSICKTEHTL